MCGRIEKKMLKKSKKQKIEKEKQKKIQRNKKIEKFRNSGKWREKTLKKIS